MYMMCTTAKNSRRISFSIVFCLVGLYLFICNDYRNRGITATKTAKTEPTTEIRLGNASNVAAIQQPYVERKNEERQQPPAADIESATVTTLDSTKEAILNTTLAETTPGTTTLKAIGLRWVRDEEWYKRQHKKGCCPYAERLYRNRYSANGYRCCRDRFEGSTNNTTTAVNGIASAPIQPLRVVAAAGTYIDALSLLRGLVGRRRPARAMNASTTGTTSQRTARNILVLGDSMGVQHFLSLLCYLWYNDLGPYIALEEYVEKDAETSKPRPIPKSSDWWMWKATIRIPPLRSRNSSSSNSSSSSSSSSSSHSNYSGHTTSSAVDDENDGGTSHGSYDKKDDDDENGVETLVTIRLLQTELQKMVPKQTPKNSNNNSSSSDSSTAAAAAAGLERKTRHERRQREQHFRGQDTILLSGFHHGIATRPIMMAVADQVRREAMMANQGRDDETGPDRVSRNSYQANGTTATAEVTAPSFYDTAKPRVVFVEPLPSHFPGKSYRADGNYPKTGSKLACDARSERGDPDVDLSDVPETYLLPVRDMYVDRGEAHIGMLPRSIVQKMHLNPRDCLHYCVSPGVLDALAIRTLYALAQNPTPPAPMNE